MAACSRHFFAFDSKRSFECMLLFYMYQKKGNLSKVWAVETTRTDFSKVAQHLSSEYSTLDVFFPSALFNFFFFLVLTFFGERSLRSWGFLKRACCIDD